MLCVCGHFSATRGAEAPAVWWMKFVAHEVDSDHFLLGLGRVNMLSKRLFYVVSSPSLRSLQRVDNITKSHEM